MTARLPEHGRLEKGVRVKRGIAGGLVLLAALGLTAFDRARRHPVQSRTDIVFSSPVGSPALKLDLHRPRDPAGLPVLLLVHGGSWKSGDKTDFAALGRRFAQEGFVSFAVNYRLVGMTGPRALRAMVGDLQLAYRWVANNAARFGGDAGHIGIVGSSAGGHLALMLATRSIPNGPAAIAAWSPPADLARLSTSSLGDEIRDLLGCSLSTCPHRYSQASPVTRVDGDEAPILLAHSDDEFIPTDQFDGLVAALDSNGVPHERRVLRGTRHGLQLGKVVFPDTVAFMRDHLTAP